jgi:hypothetical protein
MDDERMVETAEVVADDFGGFELKQMVRVKGDAVFIVGARSCLHPMASARASLAWMIREPLSRRSNSADGHGRPTHRNGSIHPRDASQ